MKREKCSSFIIYSSFRRRQWLEALQEQQQQYSTSSVRGTLNSTQYPSRGHFHSRSLIGLVEIRWLEPFASHSEIFFQWRKGRNTCLFSGFVWRTQLVYRHLRITPFKFTTSIFVNFKRVTTVKMNIHLQLSYISFYLLNYTHLQQKGWSRRSTQNSFLEPCVTPSRHRSAAAPTSK